MQQQAEMQRRLRMLVVVVLSGAFSVFFCKAEVAALQSNDIAGTLNAASVTVAEVDAASGVGSARTWQEIYRIVEAAAQGICRDRALERLIEETGADLSTWKAGLWREAEPSAAVVGSFVAAHPELFEAVDRPDGKLIAHRLRVERYRGRILAEAERVIGSDFQLLIGEFEASSLGEPRLGPIVARCLGSAISDAEVEAYAAFPLYRRRAGLVASICRQFDIDYSNPLLLARLARAESMSPEELLRSKEVGAAAVGDAEVRELAEAHYGNDDASSIAKARLALDTLNRGQARMDFLEGLRRNAAGSCALELPKAPVVSARPGPTATHTQLLPLRHFANFSCRHCAQSWQLAERLADEHAGVVAIELRHHFPDTVAPLFADAMAAECSARQAKLWDYAAWRLPRHGSAGHSELLAKAIGLDSAAFGACLADARVAVKVLDDTEEALRLGFRGAVPSWIIGRRPRRGFQGEVVLERTIVEEAAAWSARTPAPALGTVGRGVQQAKTGETR